MLGLDLDRAAARAPDRAADPGDNPPPDEVRALLDARAAARAERDFATADRIRSELADLGYGVTDGPGGQVVERR